MRVIDARQKILSGAAANGLINNPRVANQDQQTRSGLLSAAMWAELEWH